MGSKRAKGQARRRWEEQVAPALRVDHLITQYLYGDRTPPEPEVAFVLDQWRDHGKATYLVDSTFAAELASTDLPDGMVPYEVLRHRPHVAPMVVFAEPIAGIMPEGDVNHPVIYEACVIANTGHIRSYGDALRFIWVGRAPEQGDATFAIAHDVPLAPLVLTFLDAEGSEVKVTAANDDGVDLSGLAHVIGSQVSVGKDDTQIVPGAPGDAGWQSVAQVYRTALNVILYLHSEKPDMQPVPVPTANGRRLVRSGAPQVSTLGWRLGAMLRAAHSAVSASKGDGTRNVTPHLRRAHWHRFWTGPLNGERKLVVRWVSQTLVNADAAEYVPAVRPIRPTSQTPRGAVA